MNKMKTIREGKKITMLELSRKTGISERYLRFIEKGERNPSIKTAASISTALQSTIDEIFFP
ncbi:MAG: helix-turn-helix transcriptional regulator [Lachnospiraceae bacterium]|nr:helix-turn-helix transcriptional regulator [Lachnospiraceae bacterium]